MLVATVKLVADDGVAEMREVDADLMFATGARNDPQQRKISFRARKFLFDPESGLRWRAVGADAILDGDTAVFVLAERNVNQAVILAHMAVDNGQIFLLDGATLQNFSQFTGGFGIFCDDDNAAGFAVEPVDQMGLGNQ
jgi:hypothetical protein